MKIDKSIYKRSFLGFIFFLVAALTAFWPSYFTHLGKPIDMHFHAHGLSMTLWLLLLISQALLIRFKLYKFHRWSGVLSYILVPIVAVSAMKLMHFNTGYAAQYSNGHFYFFALVSNAILVYLLFYGLAIYYKNKPALHARWMVCTVFPLVSPVTDRLIYRHARWILEYVPKIDNMPIAPAAGFFLVDVIVIILAIWDYRSTGRWNVFPVALFFLLLYHWSVLYIYQFGFWQKLATWYFQLGG
ncbi:MAG: hypothetical protein R2879_19035 [Saprospiraceae bacterium]